MAPSLLERITARRSDAAFLRRLKAIMSRDRELLERLADK
jgi:hypothetical protein